MATLWVREDGEWGGWGAVPLDGTAVALRDAPGAAGVGGADGAAFLVRAAQAAGGGDGPRVLIAAPGVEVFVNASPVLGIRALEQRDEVRLGRRQWFFSTERPARAAAFAGPAGTRCARCAQDIQPGAASVRCGCGLWFHHLPPDLPCYLYSDRCPGCEGPTSLEGNFSWTPEGL